jgi:hypothetical protein
MKNQSVLTKEKPKVLICALCFHKSTPDDPVVFDGKLACCVDKKACENSRGKPWASRSKGRTN